MTLTTRVAPVPTGSSLKIAPSVTTVRGPTVPLASSSSFVEEIVVLKPRIRVCLWWLLFLVVMANITLLSGTAVVYHFNNKRGAPLWVFRIYFLSYRDGVFLQRSAPVFAASYTVILVCFMLYVLQLVFVSVKRRGLHFGARPTTAIASHHITPSPSRPFVAISASWWTPITKQLRAFRFLFSMRGPYFDFRLLVDHIIELMSQSGAAYASSRKISNVGLNLGYGIVICLTSINPLVFERVYRRSPARGRMACLVTDLALDFVWGTLLPIWTAIPIMELGMHAGPDVDADKIIAIARQIERVACLSRTHYALSVIPFIATLLTLIEIQSILREVYGAASSDQDQRESSRPHQPTMVVLKLRYAVARQEHGLSFRVLRSLVPFYGVTALLVMVAANAASITEVPSASCIHRVYPWLTTQEACVGRRIDCRDLGITGSAAEIEHAMDRISPVVLTGPREHLVGWPEHAALVAANFPVLRAVHLTAVTFEQIPPGLVAHPLPHSVNWVHLERLPNATALLTAVGDRWASLRFFDCMDCQLTEYPPALKTMHQVSMVALSFNQLDEIPDDWNGNADHVHLDALWLDVNPRLARLPDSLWRQATTTQILSLEATGLRELPDWLVDVADYGLVVRAANTPLCASPWTIPARQRAIVQCETEYS